MPGSRSGQPLEAPLSATLRAFLILIPLFCLAGLNATLINIGSGTAINQSLPWEPVLNYSYSQCLYTAAEIGSAGTIQSIGFRYTIYSPLFLERNRDISVWLGHSTRDSLNTWEPLSSLTQVFSRALTTADFSSAIPGTGYLTLTLEAPFSYDGVRNLILAVDENTTGGSNTSDDFYCSSGAVRRSCRFSSQTLNPDPANPPATPTSITAFFPNLRLDMQIIAYTPSQPIPQSQSTGIAIDAGLSWQSDAESFDVYFGTAADALDPVTIGSSQHSWIPSEPLQYLHTYYWQVIAHHGSSPYPSPVWSFTTSGETISPPRSLTGYWNGTAVQLNWLPPTTGNPTLYRIYRNATFLSQTASLSHLDSAVTPGNTYFYTVSALNPQNQESSLSNSISVSVPNSDPTLVLNDTCDAYSAFSQSLGSWTNLDLDGSATWSLENHSFPNAGAPSAWISFFPSQTSPPVSGLSPHSGMGMLACFSSLTPPNNDWLISPRIFLGENPSLRLYARSHTTDFGLERLRILISGGSADPADFSPISTQPYLEIPAVWTELNQNLATWHGQTVRLAFQCVSWDALALYLDDIQVRGEGASPISDEVVSPALYRLYPNPAHGSFNLDRQDKQPFDLRVYDLKGREICSYEHLSSFTAKDRGLELRPGVYLIHAKTPQDSYRSRIVILP